MAANSELSDAAAAWKPLGSRVSLSPCEFQICSRSGNLANSAAARSLTHNVPLPYSRFWPDSTFPPRKWVSSCAP